VRLVVGLGNIGTQYAGTRHNSGFAFIERYASTMDARWQTKDKFKAMVAEVAVDGQKVLLAKPTTLYNLSGDAVRALKDFYKLDNKDILVIHDELALPFGTIRTRFDGSDAGNNGIKSIIAAIGADFARIRVGIANEHTASKDAADFVLEQFTPEEREKIDDIQAAIWRLINPFIKDGQLQHDSWHLD